LLLLAGCFETLEKEKKLNDGQSSQSGTVIEDRFEKEIATLQSLSLSGASLEGLWLVFYSESVAETDGQSIGIDAWTILEISHEAESTSLQVLNHANCQTNTPESYQYTIDTSAISASSFRIPSNSSFLSPAAKNDVVVEIDESGRMLEFADYVKAADDANTINMKAYKARDAVADSFGSFVLDGKEYVVSCLSYSDGWVLTEASGDDIRQSEQALIGSGSANLLFSIAEVAEETGQSDQASESEFSDFISAAVQADNVSEKFATESVGGLVSSVTLNINSDLSIDANFSRTDGLEASLDVDIVNTTQ
jgi:hypothetical protein